MHKYLLLFLLISAQAFSQRRESRPLPIFSDMPYAELSDSVRGWSYSLDGQWLSQEKLIPVRGVSRNEAFYEQKSNTLGLDNFVKFQTYKVEYGRDTLVCFIKMFTEGKYEYPTRKKGWDEYLSAYYMIVNYRDLRKLKNTEQGEVTVKRVEALDGGLISDTKESKVLKAIKERVIIKPEYDRNLVFTLQLYKKDSIARFQICSLHDIFPDVEMVRRDFTRRGHTVYGSVRLFDFIYYEAKYDDLLNLFEIPLEDFYNLEDF